MRDAACRKYSKYSKYCKTSLAHYIVRCVRSPVQASADAQIVLMLVQNDDAKRKVRTVKHYCAEYNTTMLHALDMGIVCTRYGSCMY